MIVDSEVYFVCHNANDYAILKEKINERKTKSIP